MIKRQSETDIAQLLSFTYYHKLYCYDTNCICQFFTQYCQEPQKFKKKKKRIYRGYRDDGVKFVQVTDDLQSMFEQDLQQAIQQQQQQKQTNGPLNGTSFNIREIDFYQSQGESQQYESYIDQAHLSQLDLHQNNALSNTEDLNNTMNQMSGNQLRNAQEIGNSNDNDDAQNDQEKEEGSMALYNKGYILRGSAYSGYDSNLDFKIRGEFKSPSQFKTVHESRQYFFTRLLETMFKQLEQRTNKNASFTLISIYFHFAYQHNVYLSILSLIKISKALNRSMFQKMTFSVTEYYLLEMIQNEFKRNTKDEINYQNFIESNQMQQKLDWIIEDAAIDILQFWVLFKEEATNVQRAYKLALEISRSISVIRDYTIQLEEKQLIKDYNKYYYYAMFYQNLLNDKQQYNVMINNLKNLLLVRNLKKKSSRFGSTDINDIGFAIVSYEEDKSVGKFLYCNKVGCLILNISEEEILGKSVNNIMPELIRTNHDHFIKRFMQDGLPRNLGKVKNMYVKDFTDYIKPVQFFMNFFYNSKFSYSMIVHLDPIQSLTYYGSSSVIPIKYCMIFLCDSNDIIQNTSINVRKMIGISRKTLKEQEEILGRGLKMDDVIVQFARLDQFIQQNNITFLPNQQVQVKDFRDPEGLQTISCSLNYEEVVYLKGYPGQFSEKVYILIPASKIPELDNPSMAFVSASAAQGQLPIQGTTYQQVDSQEKTVLQVNSTAFSGSNDGFQLQEEIGIISGSVSSSASSSSIGSSSAAIANTKGMMFQQKSPKILKMYLGIVFCVFISFMVITSINFIIYIQKKNNVNLQIQFNLLVNQRNTYLASTILDLKQLHIISTNESQGNISNIFNQSRFDFYSTQLIFNSEKFLENHQKFKQIDQRHQEISKSKSDDESVDQIKLWFLSQNGIVYWQDNNTLDYGLSLLMSNLGMIDTKQIRYEKIPLNLNTQLDSLQKNQQVSQLFRNLYFIYTNGMNSLNTEGSRQELQIQENTLSSSEDSKLYINLISFISIGVITMIGVFTFPMLGKIEDRKISVLKFFNMLTIDHIQDLIRKGREFQDEFQNQARGMNNHIGNLEQQYFDELEQHESNANVYRRQGSSIEDFDQNKKHNGMKQGGDRNKVTDLEKINEEEKEEDDHDNDMKKQTDQYKLKSGKESMTSNDQNTMSRDKSNMHLQKQGMKDRSSYLAVTNNDEENKYARRITLHDIKKERQDPTMQYNSVQDIHNIFQKIQNNEQRQRQISSFRKYNKKKGLGMELYDAFENRGAAHNQGVELGMDGQRAIKKRTLVEKIEEEIKEDHLMKNKRANQYKASDISPQDLNQKIKKKQTFFKKYKDGKKESEASQENDDQSQNKKRNKNDDGQDEDDNEAADYENRFQQFSLKHTNRSEYIQEQLSKVALKEKLKLALYVLIVLGFLNSCLFSCFYLGQKTFQDDSKTLLNLATFYHKENCLDNLLLYTIEQYVQNQTFYIYGNKDAASYYMSKCQNTEQDYNDLRKNLPTFMKDAQSTIDGLESSNVCQVTYKSDPISAKACSEVYGQIMMRGLTSTLYTIFNQAQQLIVRFQKEFRSASFLRDRIMDQKLRDIVDLNSFYLHDIMVFLQSLITQNAIDYFDNLASYYMIIYTCYMCASIFMCGFFVLFVFRKLRQQIMTSANILAIMPLEELETKDRTKIESFLNS